jgi:hypothetical protein
MSKKDVYQSQPQIHKLLKGGAILAKVLQIFIRFLKEKFP